MIFGLILVVVLVVSWLYVWNSRRVARKLIVAGLDRNSTWYQKSGHHLMNPDAFTESIHTETIEAEGVFWETGVERTLRNKEGLLLRGRLFSQTHLTDKWVICVHGYRSNGKKDMALVAENYWQRGFNVLVPDLRAHGESEGKVIGMGWLDRLDLLEWLEEIVENYPEAQVLFHGGSMGAAAVMMVSGEKLPPQVKGFVADSGYVSVYAEFSYMLSKLTKFPKKIILREANQYAKKFAGYSLKQASATRQLGSNHLPLLVIHGTSDRFVPMSAAETALEATAGPHELLLIEEATHLRGNIQDPKRYWQAIDFFLEKIFSRSID